MKRLIQYIFDVFGLEVHPKLISNQKLHNLPIFFTELYHLNSFTLFNQQLILVQLKEQNEFSLSQIEKHLNQLKNNLETKLVLVLNNMSAYQRKKLIEKGINFIVPGKQLFLPDLLIDLTENFSNPRSAMKKKKLLPSAQFIVIYHIIHRNSNWKIEEHSFKEIADKLGYTAMAITKAINNLKDLEVIDVDGEKEKSIRFKYDRHKLWQFLEEQNFLVNPVLRKFYTDEKPVNILMLYSNTSALPKYSDLNASKKQFFAIDKTVYYGLKKNLAFVETNQSEGRYCIEIWKYNPESLVAEMHNDIPVVDPLSLYLSLKSSKDERTEMALEQIIKKFVW